MGEKRTAVLDGDICEFSESAYGKATGKEKLFPIDEFFTRQHEKRCSRVRKHGKVILRADRILRDD